ncbi:MAG: hypothetical protein GY832_43430 [Chloroflexi bacterium]|nr:hypothetical protein [Chloroflexota bacterium]
MLVLVGLFLIMLIGYEGERNILPEAQLRIDRLNNWNSEALDIVECPNLPPGFVDMGETGGWILMHKEELQKLGVSVRWNHAKMLYEIVSEEETSSALCKSHQTPISTAKRSNAELEIKKHPGNFTSFRLETRTGVTIITDPYKMDEDVQADIVTVSHYHSDHSDFSRIVGEYRLIDTVGIYEENGIRITGIAGHNNKGDTDTTNIIYVFDMDGIRLAQFASQGELPTQDMFVKIGEVDILIIQTYGWERGKLTAGEARSIIQKLQAKIVIPAHTDAGQTETLISLFGGNSESYLDGKLIVTETDLAEQKTTKIVILDVPEIR